MNKYYLRKISVSLFFIVVGHALVAQSVVDSSLSTLRGIPADSVFATVATEVAFDLATQKRYDEAIVFLDKAQRLKSSNKNIYYELQSAKCRVYYRQRDYESSMALTKSMLKDSLKMEPKTLAAFYTLAGQNNFRQQIYDEALKYYEKAYYIINKYNFKESKDDALSNLSTLYWRMGNLTEAVRYAQEAVVICRENADSNTLTRLLNTLGNINKDLGKNAEAAGYYRECSVIAERLGDNEGLILSLSSLAMIYRRAGKLDSALVFQIKALMTAEKLNMTHLMGGTYMNLASIYWDAGKLDSTRHYFHKALVLARETNDPQNMATLLSNMGFLETEMGNYKESNKILTEGLGYSKQVDDLRVMTEIYGGMYDNYKALKDYKEALSALEMYKTTQDSLLNQEKANEIDQLKTDFAVSEKEREMKLVAEKDKILADSEIKKQKYFRNASIFGAVMLLLLVIFIFQRYRERHHTSMLLAEKNKAIQQSLNVLKATQTELVATEKQREALSIRIRIARDIHDDIGSGLTKITMLSDIARKKAESSEMAGNLSKITTYSKRVSDALNEIVWAVNPTHDTLASLVSYMKNSAAQMLEDTGIQYQLDFPEQVSNQPLHPDLKRNIYLVMKESIHNAVKYSDATIVTVDFTVSDNLFSIRISDNGVGFSPDALSKNGQGNGLANMRNRMQQVRSNFKITSSPGNGCIVQARGVLYDDDKPVGYKS